MARVNVDESGIAAARQIAFEIGSKFELILGTLVVLWHDSQAMEVTHATHKQLGAWFGYDSATALDPVIHACEHAGVLRAVDAHKWEIVGNAKHIEALRQRREASKVAAERRWNSKDAPQDASRNAGRYPDPAYSEQSNAVQSSTEQSEAKKKEAKASSGEQRAGARVRGCVEALGGDPAVEGALSGVAQDVQHAWLKLYEDPVWINRELIKAISYYQQNPAKKPKSSRGWSRAFSAWLERGWTYKARAEKGSAPKKPVVTVDFGSGGAA